MSISVDVVPIYLFLNWSAVGDSDLGRTIPCARCGRSLKLNPFTIDADWHPIAKAWRKKSGVDDSN